LTTLFGNAAITTTVIPAVPASPKKHNLLPVLIVLFLISYGLMTLLIVEQGRTIESQRALIHELFHDSQELAAMKGRTLPEGVADANRSAQTQAPSNQTPSNQVASNQVASNQVQTPSIQAPSTQVPSNQAPSTQAPSTQVPSTHAPSTQVQSNKIPSTQIPSTQAAPRSRVQNRGAKLPEPEFQMPSRPASDLADDRRALKTI
jgi:FtsZ-interacting cell division protein ZipA